MSADRSDERLPQAASAQAESAAAPRSPFRTILRTMIAVGVCGGALWWIVNTMLSGRHAANQALREMGSWDPSVRVAAIQKLETASEGNGPIAIQPLIVALGDESTEVRAAAARALGPIGMDAVKAGSMDDTLRRAIAALLGGLKDPQPSVRVAAANGLASILSSEKAAGLIDQKAAVVTLTESLSDPDAAVCYAALGPLGLVAPASGVDPPKELADALNDESAGIRASAVGALVNFGRGLDPWIPSLLQMIENDKDPAIRLVFSTAETRIHPPAVSTAVVPTLIAALQRPDGQVRDVSCRVLMTFGSEARAAIPDLIAMAREEWSDSAEVDRRILALDRLAIQALAKIALKTESAGQVITVLTELVQEKSPKRCAAAVEALGEFGPSAESAIPALIRALPWKLPNQRSVLERSVAIKALGQIATSPKSSGEFIAALGKVVRTGDPGLQADAADALGEFGPAAESAVPDLIRAIEEAAPEKRYQVTWRASVALGRIAPGTKSAGDAIAVLHGLLRIRPAEANFHIAAADALGDFGPAAESAVPDLIQIVKESSGGRGEARQVMSTAARALVRMAPGTPSNEEARRALTEALPQLRAIAREGNTTMAGKAADEALAKFEGRK